MIKREEIARKVYPEVFADIETFKQLTQKYAGDILSLKEQIKSLQGQLVSKSEVVGTIESPIDAYLSKMYAKTKNVAYQNKRAVASYFKSDRTKQAKKVSYSVFLNQLITPTAYEVIKFKAEFSGIIDNYTFFQKAGDAVAKRTKWVSEQDLYDSGDFYLYPEEALTGMSQYTDCEDVSNVVASLKPELCAVCYGFYYPNKIRDANKFGHAFPVFLYENRLFIVETTGDSVEIVPIEDVRYEPIYYITINNTYKVRSGVEFGKLANY